MNPDRLESSGQLIFSDAPKALAAILLLLAVALNFTNVVSRYGFGIAIFWADEAMIFGVIWAIMLGCIAVSYEAGHLDMNLFVLALPERSGRVLAFAVSGCVILMFAIMAWQARAVVATMTHNDQHSIALDLPMAFPHSALLIGFAMSAAAVALRVVLGFRRRSSQVVEE